MKLTHMYKKIHKFNKKNLQKLNHKFEKNSTTNITADKITCFIQKNRNNI